MTFTYMYSLNNTKDNYIYRQEIEPLERMNNLHRVTQLINEGVQILSLCPHSHHQTLALPITLHCKSGEDSELNDLLLLVSFLLLQRSCLFHFVVGRDSNLE